MNKHLTNRLAGRPEGTTTFYRTLAKVFGLSLRKARMQRKLTQMALGYLADVPGNHIGKIERGETLPTLSIVVKLAHAMNMSAGELLVDAEKMMGKRYGQGGTFL